MILYTGCLVSIFIVIMNSKLFPSDVRAVQQRYSHIFRNVQRPFTSDTIRLTVSVA